MLIYKPIKPEKLKTDAMVKEIAKALKEAGEILLDAHKRIVTTWSPPPTFKVSTSRSSRRRSRPLPC